MQKEGKHYEPWCTPTCTYYSYCWQEKIENEDDRWGLGVSWGYYCDCVEDRHSLKIQKPLLLTHNNTADQQSDERITAVPLPHNSLRLVGCLGVPLYWSRSRGTIVNSVSRSVRTQCWIGCLDMMCRSLSCLRGLCMLDLESCSLLWGEKTALSSNFWIVRKEPKWLIWNDVQISVFIACFSEKLKCDLK